MVDFNDEHKEDSGAFIGDGIHKVTILGVTGGETAEGKEFIEFTVKDESGAEGNARMWFTTDKAIKYTFSVIRSLFAHNALADKKEAAKEMVNKTKNSDELVELCNKVLTGKEVWYEVEKSDRTYTNAAGELKYSYNRNLYGYEPKPKEKTALDDLIAGGQPVDSSEVPDGL